MAAVTVNRRRNTVLGSKRGLLLNINIAADQDTFDPSFVMRSIDVAVADGSSTTAVNTSFTVGGKGPITFRTTGAQTNVDVLLIGN